MFERKLLFPYFSLQNMSWLIGFQKKKKTVTDGFKATPSVANYQKQGIIWKLPQNLFILICWCFWSRYNMNLFLVFPNKIRYFSATYNTFFGKFSQYTDIFFYVSNVCKNRKIKRKNDNNQAWQNFAYLEETKN